VDPSAVPGPVPRPLRGSSTDPADDVLAGYRAPSGRVLDKVIHHLDEHCTAFIRLSPFATLATASPDGWPEVSPRGGEPGFVRVLDSSHLALPDRQGNNRIDSLRNVAENPRAALMFFVPGIDETLRVYGTTSLVPTGALGIDVTEFGRQPLSVLVLEVERVTSSAPRRSCARVCGIPSAGWSGRPSHPSPRSCGTTAGTTPSPTRRRCATAWRGSSEAEHTRIVGGLI
jgi:PPOX class probable FMN-dependent enzyme